MNWSHKFNGLGVRYEVGVSILGGDICWLLGSFRPGANPDIKSFKNNLAFQLDENERVEADNGYKAMDPLKCKTPAGHRFGFGADNAKRVKQMLERARSRHETVNSRFYAFDMLKSFRHNINDHEIVFMVVVSLVQLSIEIDSPLFPIGSNEYNDIVDLVKGTL